MSTLESPSAKRSERIHLRVEPEVDSLLRNAAQIEHKSLSSFMLDASLERARHTVTEHQRFVVSNSEFIRVLDELDRPAEVVEPLLKLAHRVAMRKNVEA